MRFLIAFALVGLAVASSDYGEKKSYSVSTSYSYRGRYQGKCSNDGIYYQDERSFVMCSNGNAYQQPCAPGSRNGAYDSYQSGNSYGFGDFCGVNLVDYGYGASGPHRGYDDNKQSYGYQKTEYRSYGNEHPEGYGYQDNSYGYRDNGYGYRDNGYGRRDNGYGYRDNGYGYQDIGYGYRDNGYGHRDNGYGYHVNAYGYHDNPHGYHNGYGYQDNSYGRDNSYGHYEVRHESRSYGDAKH